MIMKHIGYHILLVVSVILTSCSLKVQEVNSLPDGDVFADGLAFKSSGGTVTPVPVGTTFRFMVYNINNTDLVIKQSEAYDRTGTYVYSAEDTRTLRPCHLDDDGNPVLVDGKYNEDKKYSLIYNLPNSPSYLVLVSPGRMYSVDNSTQQACFPLNAEDPADHRLYVTSPVPTPVADYNIFLENVSLYPVFSKVKINVYQDPDKSQQLNFALKGQTYDSQSCNIILRNTSTLGNYFPNTERVDFATDAYPLTAADTGDSVWSTGDFYIFSGNYTPAGMGAIGISFILEVDNNGVKGEMPFNLSVSQVFKKASYYQFDIIWTSETVKLQMLATDWTDGEDTDHVVGGTGGSQVIGAWTLDGSWVNGGNSSVEI